MDLFEKKNIEPMLISKMMQPFNDHEWIYELKLDGCRCIAYLDSDKTELRNKRNIQLLNKFPELNSINTKIKKRCILDGELVILRHGIPDFYELQRRTLLTDPFKIEIAAGQLPATFVAYDCLQVGVDSILEKPLSYRKEQLQLLVKEESSRFAVSRYIHEKGVELYQVADKKELEGVVAKRWDSLYFPGKRSKDWIKFKRMEDEDFVVAGYINKAGNTYSIVLSKYQNGSLIYKGHVTSGVTKEAVQQLTQTGSSPFNIVPIGSGNDNAVWVVPDHICVVEYMPNIKNSLRQPVFKGYRTDVAPENIITQ